MQYKLLLLISLIAITTYAQKNYSLTGKVTDSNNNPLEYATVTLQNPTTNQELFGSITNAKGEFEFEAKSGDYLILVESIGLAKIEETLTVTQDENLGTFQLKVEDVVALTGAEIVSEKPIYSMELDKKVYNLDQDPSTRGSSLSDALQNVPSVQVDPEGTVSVRGNENVRILINGKPSGMIGISDPAQALQNIPAESVQRIELITNPSSRYEAAGTAGIINIILKKDARQGINGSISVNAGIPTAYGGGVNLNYKTKKFNVFTNLGYRYAEREGGSDIFNTNYTNGIISSIEDQNQNRTRTNNGYNATLGTEFFLDDKNTFTISGSFRDANNKNEADLNAYNYNGFNELTSSYFRSEVEDEEDYSIEGNLNYKHEFNTDGQELTVDARASSSREDEIGSIYQLNNDSTEAFDRSFSTEKQERYLLSADYVYPFSDKGRFELGARGDFESTYTDFSVDNLIDGQWQQLDAFTTISNYKQNVYAAYVQYGNAIGQFSYFAGVRTETSDITVESVLDNGIVRKNYTDFFPSLFLNYEFNKNNQLQLSYSKRIRRPRGWDLIPFFSYSNSTNYFRGNQDLDPQYTSSFELSYVTKIGKLMLTPNVYYSHTTDHIQHYQTRILNETTGEYNYVTQPDNIGTLDRYGADLTFSFRPYKWWNLLGNVNVFGYKTEGELITEDEVLNFDGDGVSWFGRIASNFTLPADFNFQASANYRGGEENVQSKTKAMYSLDFSLSKDLFNKKATLTFNVRDLLQTRRRNRTTFGTDYLSESEFYWSGRTFNLNFTYRFNQSKKDSRRGEQQGDFDEDGGEGM